MAKSILSDEVKRALAEKNYQVHSSDKADARTTRPKASERYYDYQEQQLERQGGRKYADTTPQQRQFISLKSRDGKSYKFNMRDERVSGAIKRLAGLSTSATELKHTDRSNTALWQAGLKKYASQAAQLRHEIQTGSGPMFSQLNDGERKVLIEYLDDIGRGVTSGYQEAQQKREDERTSRMTPEELQRYRENDIALWNRIAERYEHANSATERLSHNTALANAYGYDLDYSPDRSLDPMTAYTFRKGTTERANNAYREMNEINLANMTEQLGTTPDEMRDTEKTATRLAAYFRAPERADSTYDPTEDLDKVNTILRRIGLQTINDSDDENTKIEKLNSINQWYRQRATGLGYDYDKLIRDRDLIAENDEMAAQREETMQMLRNDPELLGLYNVLAVPLSLVNGVELVGGAFKSAWNGNEANLDRYKPLMEQDFVMTHAVTDTQRVTSEEIQRAIADLGGNETWQQVGTFGYNVAFSIAQSLLSAGIGNAAAAVGTTAQMAHLLGNTGLVLMSGSAGSSAMIDALERGASSRQAAVMGVTAALFEGMAEKIPLDNLQEMMMGAMENQPVVLRLIRQSLSEGSEEVITDVCNTFMDMMVMGYDSEFQQSIAQYMVQGMSAEEAKKQAIHDLVGQYGLSFLSGALAGGIQATGASAIGAIGNSSRRSIGASEILSDAQTGNVEELGFILSQAYNNGNEMARSIVDRISETTGKSVEELTQMGEDDKYTGSLTQEDAKTIKGSDFVRVFRQVYSDTARAERNASREAERVEEEEKRNDERAWRQGRTYTPEDHEQDVHRVVSQDKETGEVTYEDGRGEQHTADDITSLPVGSGAAEIVQDFRDTGENTVTNNNTMMAAYASYLNTTSNIGEEPVSHDIFASSWYNAQERRLLGFEADEVLSIFDDEPTLKRFMELALDKNALPEATREITMQTDEQSEALTTTENNEALPAVPTTDTAVSSQQRIGHVSLGKDSAGGAVLARVRDFFNDDTIQACKSAKELTYNQRLAVTAAQIIAEKTGVNIVFLQGDFDSHYDPKSGSIAVRIDPGNNNDYALQAVTHEALHFIADYSEYGYKELVNFVRERMGVDRFTSTVYSVAEQSDLDINREEDYAKCVEEVVAQTLEDVFLSSDGLREMQKAIKEKRGIVQKLVGRIRDTLYAIKTDLESRLYGGAPIAHGQNTSLYYSDVANLYDKFNAALEEAGLLYKQGAQTTSTEYRYRRGTAEQRQIKGVPKKAETQEDFKKRKQKQNAQKELKGQVDSLKARLAAARANAKFTTMGTDDLEQGHYMPIAGAERVVDALLGTDALKGYNDLEKEMFKHIPKYSLVNAIAQVFNKHASDVNELGYAIGTLQDLYENLATRFTQANIAKDGGTLLDDETMQSIIDSVTMAIYSEVFEPENRAFKHSKLDAERARTLYYKAKLQAQRAERVNRRLRKSIASRWRRWIQNATSRSEGAKMIPDQFVPAITKMLDLIDPGTVSWQTGALSGSQSLADEIATFKQNLHKLYGETISYKFGDEMNPFSVTLDSALSIITELVSDPKQIADKSGKHLGLSQMNREQLEVLDQQMKSIIHLVTNYDRAFTKSLQLHKGNVKLAAQHAWKYLNNVKKVNLVSRLVLSQGYTNPRLVRLMDGYNPNGVLTRMIDEGRDLRYRMQHERMQIADPFYRMIYGDPRKIGPQKKVKAEWEFKRKCEVLEDYGLIGENGENVRITKMEAMFMYLAWQRENMEGTLMHSAHDNGFQIPNHEKLFSNKGMAAALKAGTRAMVTDAQIQAMYDSFDEWDLEFLRMAQETFNGRCKELINRGAAPVLGFRVATEKGYVPMKAYLPNSQLSSDRVTPGFGYLIQSGILKAPTGASSAPIQLQGLNTILFDHIETACKIGYLLQWELDAKRIGTAKVQGDMTLDESLIDKWTDGNIHIGEAYGRAINEIVHDSAEPDIKSQQGIADYWLSGLQGMYSKYVFNANPLAALKQLSGGPLAMGYVGGIQTLSALPRAIGLMANPAALHKLINQINEHTSLVYDRTFDKDYGRIGRIAEAILHNVNTKDNPGAVMKALETLAVKGGFTTGTRIIEKFTMHDIMSFMDMIAIVSLWQPTINHVKSTWNEKVNGNAAMSNQAFAKEVTTLFEKMVSETQPMDDQIYRQQIFKGRTKSKISRFVYMFMSPAFQQFGNWNERMGELNWAMQHGDAKDRKTAARNAAMTFTGLAYSTIMNSVIMAAYAALRGKFKKYRDEETGDINWWTVLRMVGIDAASEFAESLNPFFKGYTTDAAIDYLRGKKTFTEALLGAPKEILNDVKISYIENIQTVLDSLEKAGNAMFEADDDETLHEQQERVKEAQAQLATAGSAILSVFGIPVNNIMKMADVGRHMIDTIQTGDFFSYDDYTFNAAQQKANLLRDIRSGDLESARKWADEIFEDKMDKYVEKYYADFEDAPEATRAKYIADARKSTYTSLSNYVKTLWENGEITNDEAVKLLNQFVDVSQVRGYVSVDVSDMYGVNNYYKVQEWQHKKDTKGRDVDDESRWLDIYEDYRKGIVTSSAESKLRSLYISSFKANGSSEESAIEKYNNDRKNNIKKLALADLDAGRMSQEEYEKLAVDIGIYDDELEALKEVQKNSDSEGRTLFTQAADAMRTGNTADYDRLKSSYVSAAVNSGDVKDEAEKHFDQEALGIVRKRYLSAGDVSDDEFEKLYNKYSDDEDWEKVLFVHAYKDRKEHPEDTTTVSAYTPLRRKISSGNQTDIADEINWLMTTGDRYADTIARSLRDYAKKVGEIRRGGNSSEADALKSNIQYAFDLIGKEIDWSKYDN